MVTLILLSVEGWQGLSIMSLFWKRIVFRYPTWLTKVDAHYTTLIEIKKGSQQISSAAHSNENLSACDLSPLITVTLFFGDGTGCYWFCIPGCSMAERIHRAD